jgi:transposase InsO family protein
VASIEWPGYGNQELVNEALMDGGGAAPTRAGLIHHSGQGILYSSGTYLALLNKYGLLRSMSGKGLLLMQ